MPKPSPLNIEILLATDSADEEENIRQILVPEFGKILSSNNESGALQLFRQHHPKLIMLAFDHVKKSEEFYLSLYRKDSKIYSAPHKTLLLCRGTESKQAYELCKAGILDDYVASRPMFDPWRLNWSVAQALKRFNADQNAFWLGQHIEQINNRMHQFNHFLATNAKIATDLNDEAVDNFQRFCQKLSGELGQLEKNLVSLTLKEDIFTEDSETKIASEIDQFYKNSIQAGSEKISEQLGKSRHQQQKLNQGIDDFRQQTGPDPKDKSVTQVLLIEDDDAFRETTITMLKSNTMHVMGVSDGQGALHLLQVYKPDVILLNLQLQDMDGFTVLKTIKADKATSSIPVIMLTSHSSKDVVVETMRAGACNFIVKPSDRKNILSHIKQAMQKKK